MSKISNFHQLDAWKENHKLTLLAYKITRNFPDEEKYGLISQLRRAAVSIETNIAEGFGRYHFADKIRLYHQARGSASEVQSLIIVAKDLGFLEEGAARRLWKQSEKGAKLLNGLIRSVGNKNSPKSLPVPSDQSPVTSD